MSTAAPFDWTTQALAGAVRAVLPFKSSVRVVGQVNLVLAGLQTVDGVALHDGDDVLVAGQSDGTQNGIFTANPGAWVRRSDTKAGGLLGAVLYVREGGNAGSLWRLSNTVEPLVGSTVQTWTPLPVNAPAIHAADIHTSGSVSLALSRIYELHVYADVTVTLTSPVIAGHYVVRVINEGGVPTFAGITWPYGAPTFSTTLHAVDEFVIDVDSTGSSGGVLGFSAASSTDALSPLTYTRFVDLSQSGKMTVPSSSGALVFVVDAATTPTPGAIQAVFVPATHTTSVDFAPEWGPVGGTLNPAVDNTIYFECDVFGRLGATVRVYPAHDAVAPTITSATVNNAAPANLVLAASESITAKSLANVSVTLAGVTILSVSGLNTNAPVLLLSRAILGTDAAFSVVFAAGNTFQDLNGNALAPVTKSVTNNVLSGFPSLPGLVGEYDLKVADVTISSGVLASTLKDVSGNAFDLTQGTPAQQGDWTASDSDFGGSPSINSNKASCFYSQAGNLTVAPTSSEFTLHFVIKFPLGANSGGAWTFAGDNSSIALGVNAGGFFYIFSGGSHATTYNVSSIAAGEHEVTFRFSTAGGGTLTVYIDKVSVGSVASCGTLAGGLSAFIGGGSGQELEAKCAYLVIYDHAQTTGAGSDIEASWAIMRAKGLGLTY